MDIAERALLAAKLLGWHLMQPISNAGGNMNDILKHLDTATDKERRKLAHALLRLQLRDGNNTRNLFLYELALMVHAEETRHLCWDIGD